MEFKSVFVLLGIFALFAVTVDALSCYACQGTNDSPCFDPVEKNAPTANCSTVVGANTVAVCFKVLGPLGNNELVIRGCNPASTIDVYCAAATAADSSVDCVYCDDEDLCNGSDSTTVISVTFLVLSCFIAKML